MQAGTRGTAGEVHFSPIKVQPVAEQGNFALMLREPVSNPRNEHRFLMQGNEAV